MKSNYKKCSFAVFLFFLFFNSIAVLAQQRIISGTVKSSKDNQPLIGVGVTEKSVKNSTSTNLDGKFSITVSGKNNLIFSYLGFKTIEVPVSGNTVNIVLEEDLSSLNEVVVVGYGTQKRSDVTGAVASIPKERLEQLPNTNIAQALQGSIPGLQINTNGGGAEGNNVEIILRGRNSITAGNGPLIIYDGVPYEGGISEINPNDIASIEVLKDASAAAIYGSRGSNGVILVTSKKGKNGDNKITYDGFYGTQTLVNKPNLMNGVEFYNFKTTRLNAVNTISDQEKRVFDAGAGVDWYKLATQVGSKMQHSLSVNGGSDKANYYLGGTFLDSKGVSVNDEFKRYSLKPNLNINVTKWLSIASNSQFSLQDRGGLPAQFDDTNSTGGGAGFFNPLTEPYNPDGSIAIYAYIDANKAGNPLGNLLVSNVDKYYKIFTANSVNIDFPFLKGLSYKLNTGVEYGNSQRKTYYGRNVALGFEKNGVGTNYNSINRNFTIENILNFNRTFGKHTIGVTALYSSQSSDFDRDQLTGTGFPNDVLTSYQMQSALLLEPSIVNTKENLLSQMVRVNYGFKSKYLLTVTARRDGFSAFGANTKYGTFPSVAVAWNIFKEDFMKKLTYINNLKLRGSYGINGNQAISPYSSLATLQTLQYLNGSTVLQGYSPNKLANGNLGWESTKSLSIGLDFGLFNNRIQGNLDYYNAKTSNLLLKRTLSPVQGISSVIQNIGQTANNGIELGLTSINIDSKTFKWSTNVNLSHNTNKIVDLYGDGKDDLNNNWFIGQPINVFYGLKYNGFYRTQDEITAEGLQLTAKPGYVKILDADGNGSTSTSADRVILGQQDPKFIFGFTNIFNYKAFSMMVFLQGTTGNIKQDPFWSDAVFGDTRRNTTLKNWWSPINLTGDHFANDANANKLGVNFYESADFARLKDVSLAYNLPSRLLQKAKISGLKVYATGRNLATFTSYKALDPEFTNQYGLPLQREIVFGLTLTL
ncbi:MAG: TonB-dependent receptor [Oligoflexus sp.]|nr:TonB-dependent receptor [Pseudopedobacter sp.]